MMQAVGCSGDGTSPGAEVAVSRAVWGGAMLEISQVVQVERTMCDVWEQEWAWTAARLRVGRLDGMGESSMHWARGEI